ncbi:DNA methyltransferase [Mycobacterium phage OwlsT2W]|uniref:Methyltransferase n=1 Tax=Mycobacterium phage OwlsT2W TaxID=2126954 RepID=A0A2R4AQB0_9CAUD|nr:DNA methyltransferase [Mycobacterium phage OwlsT2W]AVR77234.1 methyltransferase [Mycobacterium phage OwlsT2W]
MTPYYQDDEVTLYHGDCLDVIAKLPDNSVDSVCTDPPYGLEFMGKDWDSPDKVLCTASQAVARPDAPGGISPANGRPSFLGGLNPKCTACNRWQRGANPCRCSTPSFTDERGPRLRAFQAWCEQWAGECLRVLKPGGYLVAFGGSRTWHRLACAVEDAGFEIRDSIAWLNGSGFPKSLDVSKAIDKAAGAEREVIGTKLGQPGYSLAENVNEGRTAYGTFTDSASECAITAPATEAAKQWQGWGTALKPSYEPVCVAVKPYGVTDILDAIGSHITRLEDECRPPANGAARSSAPTPADSQEVRTDTAPESAATPHEGEQARTTPTGAAAGSSAATDTSAFELEGETCWSTVTSWRACWDELYDLTSTSTTSTASSLTTDLRTLWSSIASLTVTSTPDSPTPRLTSSSTASAVDSLFAATVLRSRATLALSAPESATASTQPSPQGAGGRNTAFEPIVVARKPLVGTVAANVLEHGTGALNIDACRIGDGSESQGPRDSSEPSATRRYTGSGAVNIAATPGPRGGSPSGRWPTNVVLDGEMADQLDEQSGITHSRASAGRNGKDAAKAWGLNRTEDTIRGHNDSGGASRFFPVFRYEAKAPGAERPSVVTTKLRLRADLTPEQVDHVVARLREAGVEID